MLIVNSSSSRSIAVRSIGEVPMTCASVRPTASRPICSGVRVVSAYSGVSGVPGLTGGRVVGLIRSPHFVQPGTVSSVFVKITGSPPIGKSRRCGKPT